MSQTYMLGTPVKIKLLSACITVALSLAASVASAGTLVYANGTNQLAPSWDNNSNDVAMNSAFGAGAWSRVQGYSTAMFTGADFVFIDGSAENGDDFSAFLAANSATIASYVDNGGRLFLNSAPYGEGSLDLGFGVTLDFGSSLDEAIVSAAGVAAGLTYGGLTTHYVGSTFAHGPLSGGGISSLITDPSGGIIFGAKQSGTGFVAFGSQSLTTFHTPQPDAAALLANELRYVQLAGARVGPVEESPVPEPTSIALLGLGLIGVAAARRKAA
jgi:hypothetical protein